MKRSMLSISLSSLLLAAASLLVSSAVADSPEQQGLSVAVTCEKANNGFKSERAELTMDLVNAHGDSTSRKIIVETQEETDDGDRSRFTFIWPADVKGTRLLTWSHRADDDDQWLYLPAIKRTKRIASNNKNGALMGSEFAYEDLASQEVGKYTYKLNGEAKEQGRDVWKLDRYPVSKNSGYTRQAVLMDKEYKGPLVIDYYDRKGELLKTATFSDYREFGKLWRPGKIDMYNVQTKKRSVITWTTRRLDAQLDDKIFKSEALEN